MPLVQSIGVCNGRLLWARQWTFSSHKSWRIPWITGSPCKKTRTVPRGQNLGLMSKPMHTVEFGNKLLCTLYRKSTWDHLGNVGVVTSNLATGMDSKICHHCFKQTDYLQFQGMRETGRSTQTEQPRICCMECCLLQLASADVTSSVLFLRRLKRHKALFIWSCVSNTLKDRDTIHGRTGLRRHA